MSFIMAIRCACGKEATFKLAEGAPISPAPTPRPAGAPRTIVGKTYSYGLPAYCPMPGCIGSWRTEMGRHRHNSNNHPAEADALYGPRKPRKPRPPEAEPPTPVPPTPPTPPPPRKPMVRNFPCPKCPKMLPNPGSVRMHMLVHQGT